jgi:hypothetical protein
MVVSTNEGAEQMFSRKLTKPAAVAAAAIVVGSGSYTASALLLPSAAAAAQIREAGNRNVSVNKLTRVRPSAAAIGLARDFGISHTAAQELIESTYH